jgi:hypothetical protein
MALDSQGFATGGGKSRASTVLVKFWRLCEPSQKGWLPEWLQRQSEMAVRPAKPNVFPAWSLISNSPSILIGPLLNTVTLVADKESSIGHTAKVTPLLYQFKQK